MMKTVRSRHYVDEKGRRIAVQRMESESLYHVVITSDHAEAIDQIESAFLLNAAASTVPTTGTKQ
jgi:hypothetical protein